MVVSRSIGRRAWRLNTFYNSAIKPVLENPVADVDLGLGAAALTGGLLAPEIGGCLALEAPRMRLLLAPPLPVRRIWGPAAPTALGFAGDVPRPLVIKLVLTNPLSIPGGADLPSLALSSGVTDVTPTADLPSLASSVAAASPGLSSFASTGDYLSSAAFDPSAWTTSSAATTPVSTGALPIAPPSSSHRQSPFTASKRPTRPLRRPATIRTAAAPASAPRLLNRPAVAAWRSLPAMLEAPLRGRMQQRSWTLRRGRRQLFFCAYNRDRLG
jgi:hypothetical protein